MIITVKKWRERESRIPVVVLHHIREMVDKYVYIDNIYIYNVDREKESKKIERKPYTYIHTLVL